MTEGGGGCDRKGLDRVYGWAIVNMLRWMWTYLCGIDGQE